MMDLICTHILLMHTHWVSVFISRVGLCNLWAHTLLYNLKGFKLSFQGLMVTPRWQKSFITFCVEISQIKVEAPGTSSCLILRAKHAVFWDGRGSGGGADCPLITVHAVWSWLLLPNVEVPLEQRLNLRLFKMVRTTCGSHGTQLPLGCDCVH